MPKTIQSGVYAIRNKINSKIYIGSTSLFYRRFSRHRVSLRNGTHPNQHLQAAWNKYGEDNFSFTVLELCDPVDFVRVEQGWIDFHQSYKRERGYNKSPSSGSPLGYKHTEEACKNMGRSRKGKPFSESHKRNMSIAKKNMSQETKNKMSAAARKRSPEHYAKMVETRRIKNEQRRMAL